MDFKAEEILSCTEKVLGLIKKNDLAGHDMEWIIYETLNGFRDSCDPVFLEYHNYLFNDYVSVKWNGSEAGFTQPDAA